VVDLIRTKRTRKKRKTFQENDTQKYHLCKSSF